MGGGPLGPWVKFGFQGNFFFLLWVFFFENKTFKKKNRFGLIFSENHPLFWQKIFTKKFFLAQKKKIQRENFVPKKKFFPRKKLFKKNENAREMGPEKVFFILGGGDFFFS